MDRVPATKESQGERLFYLKSEQRNRFPVKSDEKKKEEKKKMWFDSIAWSNLQWVLRCRRTSKTCAAYLWLACVIRLWGRHVLLSVRGCSFQPSGLLRYGFSVVTDISPLFWWNSELLGYPRKHTIAIAVADKEGRPMALCHFGDSTHFTGWETKA